MINVTSITILRNKQTAFQLNQKAACDFCLRKWHLYLCNWKLHKYILVNLCNKVADEIKKENISCTVLDLRTLSPLDEESVLEAAAETGRVVIVDESYPRCNIATDISALICEKSFSSLKSPIKMVTPPHTPVPFSPVLEDLYLPSAEKIKKTISSILK